MSAEILEIGSGSMPALLQPGAVLQQPDSRYVGLDASFEEGYSGRKHVNRVNPDAIAPVVVSDSAELPFRDSSFSHVIMRSVFGEYTMRPEHTASNLENTRLGVYEIFRVLRASGEVYIAEENTPEPPASAGQIAGSLVVAGFENVAIYPCQETDNPHWSKLRTDFWEGNPIDARWGYLVHATRPVSDLTAFTSRISAKSVWRANRERGWGHPDNAPSSRLATFYKTATPPKWGKSDVAARDAQVSVVSRDKTTDLDSYLRAVAFDGEPHLFL